MCSNDFFAPKPIIDIHFNIFKILQCRIRKSAIPRQKRLKNKDIFSQTQYCISYDFLSVMLTNMPAILHYHARKFLGENMTDLGLLLVEINRIAMKRSFLIADLMSMHNLILEFSEKLHRYHFLLMH